MAAVRVTRTDAPRGDRRTVPAIPLPFHSPARYLSSPLPIQPVTYLLPNNFPPTYPRRCLPNPLPFPSAILFLPTYPRLCLSHLQSSSFCLPSPLPIQPILSAIYPSNYLFSPLLSLQFPVLLIINRSRCLSIQLSILSAPNIYPSLIQPIPYPSASYPIRHLTNS